MWELVSFMLGLGVFMLVMEYWVDPRKLIKDLGLNRDLRERVETLERRLDELEKQKQHHSDDS